VLYGVMMTQVYMYFNSYKKDRLWMKCLVFGLFVADTTNSVFDVVYVYNALVVHFGDMTVLNYSNWVFATDPAMTGIIAAVVQLFFAWRVKVVTGNIWAVSLIVAMSVTTCLGGIGTAIATDMIVEFVDFMKFKVIVIIWLVASAVADVAIAVALTFHLQSHKTGFATTDDIVNGIIRLTIQTGAVTAFCAMMDLILFFADDTGIHFIFNVPLSKLYTNSLMSSLNSRGGWKYSQQTGETASNGVTANTQQTDIMQLTTTTRPKVFIHVESHELVDVDNKNPSRLLDGESEQEYRQTAWESKRDKSENSMV